MKQNNRVTIAKNTLTTFVKNVLRDGNGKVRVALVTYGSDVFDGREVNEFYYNGNMLNRSHKTFTTNPQDIINKIGETRFIVFADNFFEAIKCVYNALIQMGISVDYTCLDYKGQFGFLSEDEVYSESSKKGYIIVIYEELKEFGYFVVEENTNV